MDRRQRFRLGLIVLLLTPLAVLAAFAAYVYWANGQPQTGEMQTRVSPQVVMPWGEAVYYIDYAGSPPPPPPPVTLTPVPTPTPRPTPVAPPPQIDMVFIVDESSSMTSSMGAMAAAAQGVMQDLAKERRGRIHYAAIRFDDRAEVQTDWTDDPDQLSQGLSAIAQQPRGGDTNGLVALGKLNELLATARPKANKVVIFYTDGVMYGLFSYRKIVEDARKLREDQQVSFYSVGLPYVGSDPIMVEVTGDANKIKDPMNPQELARLFQEIKAELVTQPPPTPEGEGVGPKPTPTPPVSSGYLSHRLDGRHFSTPIENTNWTPGGGGISLRIQPVPEGPVTYAHPLVPLSAGLWRVGVEPPRLVFSDKDGVHRPAAERRPLLLKVTYFTLLLMLLPALLWALAHIRRQPRRTAVVEKKKELELPPIPPQSLPDPLPLLPRLALERLAPIPTLFVGLGGGGRRALHAVRADLKQAHLGHAGEPYRFLCIDTDTQEAERESPFEDWEGYKIESLVAPPAVRQTESYLPEPGRGPDHMQWFNAYAYREAPRTLLNLADGAKGARALARLALFRWLSAPNGVFPTLVEHFKQLAALPAVDGARQVVVFAPSDGGVGSGWFLDFGRLFQRIARQQQSQGLEALPDVIGVLCEDPERRHPENRRAVTMELETAMTARKFPQRVTYAPGETLLDQVDAQSPYHWVFSVAADDKNSVAAQCGELASVLVERHPRASLLDQAQIVPAHMAVAAKSFSAHVLPTLIYDQVRCELFLRMLGPDILLDIVADTQGGLRPQTVAADRAGELLDDWSRTEAPGSPLQLLLRAAVDPSAAGFANLMRETPSAPLGWFGEAFSTTVTQRLQGRAVGEGAWERGWKPGEAVAALRLLAARLERNLKPELRTRNAPTQATEVADHVISLANSAAADLERWVQDFCRVCEQVAAQRNRLDQARRQLLRLQGRVYLDLELNPDHVKGWARGGLESWLGTPDTVSAIRKRLFFGVTADGSRAQAAVHSYIAEPQRFATAQEAAAAIDRLAGALALNVPAMRIGGVLATTPDERRRELARELVRAETQPQQVLVILPQTTGLGREERQAVEEFGKAIPKPPAHGPRAQQNGDDHSAVRRLELTEAAADTSTHAGGALPFIEMAESIAEAVRRRAEKKYQIALPIFPPRLRIALGSPSAFRSFARAYKAGHIDLRQDDNGQDQWIFTDTGQFLSFEKESSLAHAAANYVRDVANHPESFATSGSGGSFAKLEQWRVQRVAPDPDTLTQIAVDVYEQ